MPAFDPKAGVEVKRPLSSGHSYAGVAGTIPLLVDDVRPDCSANFRFQSPDVSFNSRREGQNRKCKRDGAAGYGEDHNVMVCEKHGVHHGNGPPMLCWGGRAAVKGFSDSPANRQLGD
jgi:hypothetical protein